MHMKLHGAAPRGGRHLAREVRPLGEARGKKAWALTSPVVRGTGPGPGQARLAPGPALAGGRGVGRTRRPPHHLGRRGGRDRAHLHVQDGPGPGPFSHAPGGGVTRGSRRRLGGPHRAGCQSRGGGGRPQPRPRHGPAGPQPGSHGGPAVPAAPVARRGVAGRVAWDVQHRHRPGRRRGRECPAPAAPARGAPVAGGHRPSQHPGDRHRRSLRQDHRLQPGPGAPVRVVAGRGRGAPRPGHVPGAPGHGRGRRGADVSPGGGPRHRAAAEHPQSPGGQVAHARRGVGRHRGDRHRGVGPGGSRRSAGS